MKKNLSLIISQLNFTILGEIHLVLLNVLYLCLSSKHNKSLLSLHSFELKFSRQPRDTFYILFFFIQKGLI